MDTQEQLEITETEKTTEHEVTQAPAPAEQDDDESDDGGADDDKGSPDTEVK
jgi:hypothetical protein